MVEVVDAEVCISEVVLVGTVDVLSVLVEMELELVPASDFSLLLLSFADDSVAIFPARASFLVDYTP